MKQLAGLTTRAVIGGALALAIGVTAGNTAPVITGDHYEDYKSTSTCFTPKSCGLAMTVVPTGKNLLVTDISCVVTYTDAAPRVVYFQFGHLDAPPVTGDKGKSPYTFLVPVLLPLGTGTTTRHYVANAQVNQLFKPGQIPYFFHNLLEGTIDNFGCSIFGTLIPIPS